MARILLVGLAVIIFIVILGSLMYSLYSAIHVIPRLTNSTKNIERFTESNPRMNIVKMRYSYGANASSPCDGNVTRLAIILETEFRFKDVPDSCIASVDGRLAGTIRPLAPPAENNTFFIELIALKAQILNKPHNIDLCCDGSCIRRKIEKAC
jgi:hypothetical protein